MAASASGGSEFDPRAIELVDGADGYSAEAVFSNPTTYTYDDLIMLPGYIDFTTADVKLETKLTRNITLNVPFVSSPMDTVTEVRNLLLADWVKIGHQEITISMHSTKWPSQWHFKEALASSTPISHRKSRQRRYAFNTPSASIRSFAHLVA